MGHPHAAANGNIEANEFSIFNNRDVAKVMGEDIGVIVGRNNQNDFEFTRQVVLAIKRFAIFLRL